MFKQNLCQGFHQKKKTIYSCLTLLGRNKICVIKIPNPPITFLMVHPLLTFKPQANTRKYQLKHSFIITFIASVLRILNMTYNVFGKRYKPQTFFIYNIFAWYKNIFETKTKIQMICFLPHCFFCSPARVSFNHVTGLQPFLKESRLFFPEQAEYSYFSADVRLNNILNLVNIIMKSSNFYSSVSYDKTITIW